MEYDKGFYQNNFFRLERYRVSADKHSESEREENEAIVKIVVPAANAKGRIGKSFIAENQQENKKFISLTATANGRGTVDALDSALRKILEPIYPFIKDVRLIRYGVTNTTAKKGTAAEVEVFILASNAEGKLYFSEVSSYSVIEASFFALSNIYNRYFRDEYENKRRGGKC
ncbi:MAG TPA: alpha-isopropylmalate synthase regulatory domain-containing protein [bacterium]|nr:alpha-isopropylmalate synthase regulatory domain-containing protein [bacterium]